MGKVGVMKKPVTLSSRVARAGTLMVLPSLCIIAVFVLYPIADSFWMSLHNWNILKNTKSFLGLSNYMQAFHDERFLNALKNTVVYTITYVPILVVSSLLIAVFLNYGFSGAGFFKSLFFPSIHHQYGYHCHCVSFSFGWRYRMVFSVPPATGIPVNGYFTDSQYSDDCCRTCWCLEMDGI
jgi:hypothetical protein